MVKLIIREQTWPQSRLIKMEATEFGLLIVISANITGVDINGRSIFLENMLYDLNAEWHKHSNAPILLCSARNV